MNGARDLGALEADWRPRYAEDIGGHCTVTAASPEVRESAEGRVCLPDGSIEGTFGATARPARRSVGVNVTGTGVLSMYLNGELAASFTASGATQEHTFQMPAAGGTFSFAYEPGPGDTGGAEIVEFQRLLGTSIIFR